jgi:hypothetical protein
MPKMKKRTIKINIAILILYSVLTGQAIASFDQTEQQIDLVAEYSKHMGFAKKQVLDVSITESVMKVSINECSFCGVLKNDKKRSDLAHKTLDWFLQKTGQKEGTVEWYNKSQTRIMTISGTGAQAEITSGPSCAIKQQKTE